MATTPAARLAPGELRRQVAAYLSEHSDRDHTPGEIAGGLAGRSTGAVTWEFAAVIEELRSASVTLWSAAEPFTDRNPDDLPTMPPWGWTGSKRAHSQASRASRMLRGRQ